MSGWLCRCGTGSEVPRAVLFWRFCEARLRATDVAPVAEEAAFVFWELVRLEAYERDIVFIATDGSRDRDEEHNVICGRACLVFDAAGGRVFGGHMAVRADGMERHSYETELQAFIDGLASLPQGSAVAVVTDCLSGAMAAAIFGRRPLHVQAGFIGRIEMVVPWHKLKTLPVTIELQQVR